MGNTTGGSNPSPSAVKLPHQPVGYFIIRAKTMDSIIWTGNNVDAVEKFALDNHFGFVVGSSYGRERWWHRLFDNLAVPSRDMTVLEIYPDHPKGGISKFLDDYSAAEVTEVLRYLKTHPLYGIIEAAFTAIESKREGEYTPWHWTTANPGDRIFADGSVERNVV